MRVKAIPEFSLHPVEYDGVVMVDMDPECTHALCKHLERIANALLHTPLQLNAGALHAIEVELKNELEYLVATKRLKMIAGRWIFFDRSTDGKY